MTQLLWETNSHVTEADTEVAHPETLCHWTNHSVELGHTRFFDPEVQAQPPNFLELCLYSSTSEVGTCVPQANYCQQIVLRKVSASISLSIKKSIK